MSYSTEAAELGQVRLLRAPDGEQQGGTSNQAPTSRSNGRARFTPQVGTDTGVVATVVMHYGMFQLTSGR